MKRLVIIQLGGRAMRNAKDELCTGISQLDVEEGVEKSSAKKLMHLIWYVWPFGRNNERLVSSRCPSLNLSRAVPAAWSTLMIKRGTYLDEGCKSNGLMISKTKSAFV